MDTKILVCYGSKYGATAEIAEKIGETLQAAGFATDVINAKEIQSADGYGAVVVGSAAYIGQWRKEAVRFVRKNTDALSRVPVWVFASGPTDEKDAAEALEGWLYPDKLKESFDKIQPKEFAIFHGAVNYEKMSGIERWMMKKFMTGEKTDFRRWDEITAWANKIAAALS